MFLEFADFNSTLFAGHMATIPLYYIGRSTKSVLYFGLYSQNTFTFALNT